LSWRLERKLQVGLFSAIGIFLVIGLLSYYNVRRLTENSRLVTRTQKVLAELETTLAAVTDVESGTRGYVITGDSRFLDPVHLGVPRVRGQLQVLRELTPDNARQQERLAQLASKAEEKIRFNEQVVAVRQTEGAQAATRLIETGKGKLAMDEIRRLTGEMAGEEDALLIQRTEESERAAIRTTVAMGALVLLAMILLAGAHHVTRRDLAYRRRAEEGAQEAQAKLQESISQLEKRTAEITLLSQLAQLLQVCQTQEEAYRVVVGSAQKLFPTESGALCVLKGAHQLVEVVASWGDTPGTTAVFSPEDCWALRSGRAHCVDDPGSAVRCPHVTPTPALCYLCIPLMAQGEALGILHLQGAPQQESTTEAMQEHLKAAKKELASTLAEHTALALANLRLRDTLRIQSIRDPLTGAFNRRYMVESLERELHRATRSERPLGAILVDIDHFKKYNDTYGHEAGDALLKELAKFLQSQVRGGDIACRYGGEEFVLILPEASPEVTLRRAEQMREGVKRLNIIHNGQPLGRITLSLGVAGFPGDGQTHDELLRAADAALYQAKERGRDRVVVGQVSALKGNETAG
jgi:diguanylate cyclase (GGDEF)-like protein